MAGVVAVVLHQCWALNWDCLERSVVGGWLQAEVLGTMAEWAVEEGFGNVVEPLIEGEYSELAALLQVVRSPDGLVLDSKEVQVEGESGQDLWLSVALIPAVKLVAATGSAQVVEQAWGIQLDAWVVESTLVV